MATFSTPLSVDECEICVELLKNPRALNCGHIFCLNCLETMERNKIIPCPICREETKIPVGLQVKHLPKKMPKTSGKAVRSKVCTLDVIKSIPFDNYIGGLIFDEENQTVIVGLQRAEKPYKMFSLMGEKLTEFSHPGLKNPRVTMDTTRHLIVVGSGGCDTITMFNDDGEKVGSITHAYLSGLEDLAYCRWNDELVIADYSRHQLHFLSMATEKIRKSVPAPECRLLDGNVRNVYVVTSKRAGVPLIATLDYENALVKLYSQDGELLKTFGAGSGTGYGKLNGPCGLCFDYQGRILVSDFWNKRLVRLNPDVEEERSWELILDTSKNNLCKPTTLDVAEDGIVAISMVMRHNKKEMLCKLVLFKGYE